MRADEYIIQQYLEVKSENDKLKKQLEEYEEKNKNTEVVYLDKTIYEIYYCRVADSYAIKRYITEDESIHKTERINELKELLETDDIILFREFEINYGYYSTNYLVSIDEVQCQYKVKYMEDNQPKETDIAKLTPDAMIHYNEQMVAVLYPSGRVFKKKRISTIYDVKRHDFASSELMQLSYEAMVHNGGKVKRLGEKK